MANKEFTPPPGLRLMAGAGQRAVTTQRTVQGGVTLDPAFLEKSQAPGIAHALPTG